MAGSPPIVLLTDFGSRDGYPGVMKGVILGIAPGAVLVDLTHEIAPQDVAGAAWALHTAWRYFPLGTIFLCVVDPGVGSTRRPVALAAGGRLFVGPDNGLFSYVLAAAPPDEAVALDDPRFHLPHPSATFHGRDIFAPCAAHLARGIPLGKLGSAVAVTSLVTFALPRPVWQGDMLHGHVLHVDRFGNLITDVAGALAAVLLAIPSARLAVAGRDISARAHTFAEGPEGEPFLLADSSGHLAIAVRNGSAAALLSAGRGDEVVASGVPRERADEPPR
jgi:S-adenosyl-L-methionine hydrolase (adenosine-forming)